MARKIYWATVLKKYVGIPVGTAIGFLFIYLIAIGAISNVSYSGDMVCAGTIDDPCYAFINFTANEDIFIYPTNYDPWGRDTLFNFDPAVKSWKLERSWGKGWREIDLTTNCKGTWCGAPDNSGRNTYSIVFREGRDYKIRITGYKNNPKDTIKWGAFSGVDEIDPVWFGMPERYTPPYTIGEKCYGSYDSENQIMTDTSCLQFKTETNGVITINNERYLSFALKGIIDGNEIIRTSMDFGWTWEINETNGDYIFTATNDNPNFIWKQYYYFYEDYNKPMKIEHYLENNLTDITDMQMYYLTNVLPTDEIEYNETRYLVSDYMGLHKQGDFTELISTINFNAEYNLNFEDLIDKGFTINEFYIGSGSVINKPNINITAIGFTKNNGNFPKGSSIWTDPSFTTENLRGISLTPLDENTFVVAWCDATASDTEFLIYDTNGTAKTSQINVDTSSSCFFQPVFVSALNSTTFVVVWYDGTSTDDILFSIYDSAGNLLTGPITVDPSVGNLAYSVSVSALNSTTFVVGWYNSGQLDASFRVYDSAGNPLTSIIDADTNIGGGAVSVSALNSTTFVVGWKDDDVSNTTFSIYDSAGNLLTGPITVDGSIGVNAEGISSSALNSTTFVIAWVDNGEQDASFRVYDSAGNPLTSIIDADTSTGSNGRRSVSVSALNSTTFVVGWYDDGSPDYVEFSIYNSAGTKLAGPMSTITTGYASQAVSSYLTTINIGICDYNFIQAFTVSTTLSNWTAYYPNGTVWDGVCEEAPPADTCSPSSPLSSNYAFTCSDNCTQSTNLDAGGFNITITDDVGTFTLTANITNYNKIFIVKPSSCNVVFDGGKLIK